ncbi:mitogen-activated protein kinase 3-like isoform X2 [Ipomoea triloba]|uniref:mitogen-activated protein kinase 3-like isoform X2 n=1 Tax=Ipomoea triloba TaxID=35885 RepID=UPI00125E9BF9|nr:mitogen-activated protein kinase 3-like isoform X2 [Ipomoea triloba]
MKLLGTPTEYDLICVRNGDAKRYIRQLPQHPRQQLAKVFHRIHPSTIDLVDKMLSFDPSKRITVRYNRIYVWGSTISESNELS